MKLTDRMFAPKMFNGLNFCFDTIYRNYCGHAMKLQNLSHGITCTIVDPYHGIKNRIHLNKA